MKITEEMIRIKAYELWEASGKPMGSAEEHWFAALTLLQDGGKTTSSRKSASRPNGLRQLSPS